MKRSIFSKIYRYCLGTAVFLFANINLAMAGTIGSTGMPWESPLQKILDSISGPVAKILGVIVIVLAGLGIAFGEAGSGMRKVFQIVMGLSIAFTATSLVTSLFGASSGTVF